MAERRVAVLGTGIMGSGMARSLLRAGHHVSAWNRTEEKAQPLAQEGAVVAASPAEAVKGADVVVTMLADGPTTAELMEGLLGEVQPDAVWAQMGTVGLESTEQLARLAGDAGVGFVDAPVLGTKQPAEKGELLVLASGPAALRERCTPVFDAVGKATLWLGEEPRAASGLKLVINHWLLGLVVGLAETIGLARALGVDPAKFLEAIDGGPINSPYAQIKGMAMLKGEFEPSFPLRLAHKDLSLVLEAAEARGFDAPLATAAASLFVRADDLGHGDEDMSAVYAVFQPAGEAEPPD
jgi:3-hydroxyisobutyrate dehydrogenase